jgi:membrane protein required for colicin V production
MIWIDYVLIGLVSVPALIGVIKGLKQQAYSFLWWLVAVAVGLSFSYEFTRFLKPTIIDPAGLMAASFALLCILTLLVGGIIRLLLGSSGINSGLNLGERLGGLLFGILHGIIFAYILVLLSGISVLPRSPWWKQAKLIPPLQAVAVWSHDHIPSELTKNVSYR